MIERERPTPEPCPFCEAAGIALQDFQTGRWWVKCKVCQARGPNQPDQYRAIIRWNRRPKEGLPQ